MKFKSGKEIKILNLKLKNIITEMKILIKLQKYKIKKNRSQTQVVVSLFPQIRERKRRKSEDMFRMDGIPGTELIKAVWEFQKSKGWRNKDYLKK